jgi:hypothetical protein
MKIRSGWRLRGGRRRLVAAPTKETSDCSPNVATSAEMLQLAERYREAAKREIGAQKRISFLVCANLLMTVAKR